MSNPDKLRELACWYCEFADRAENPAIWEAHLRMADDLEAEATRIEARKGRDWDRGGCGSSYPYGYGHDR